MTTMKDVAKLAGVSTATVSRALMKPEMVSKEMRERVTEAVERAGYTPDLTARSLRRRETKVVMVVVPDISNPFFSEIIRGMGQVAGEHGYSVLLGDTENDPERERAFASLVGARQADGLILLNGRLPRPGNGGGAQAHLPSLVMACEYQPDVEVPTVRLDNVGASRKVMQYLLEGGHRRIGFLSGPMWNVLSRDRLQGYRDSLLDAGLPYDPALVAEGDFTIASGLAGGREIMGAEPRPTAIFCSNDEMAIGAIQAGKAAGLRIPKELSVVGFDDIQFAAAYDPPLTTIVQPRLDMGREAMTMLCNLLEHRDTHPETVVFPGELVIRESSAPLH